MKGFFAFSFLLLLAFTAGHPFVSNERLADSHEILFPEDLFKAYPYEDQDSYEDSTDDSTEGPLVGRQKRQAVDHAMGLALNHDNPPGRIHSRLDLNAVGNNDRNFHAQGGVGLGSVVWKSPNDRHSLGVGAYVEQQRGRYQGFGYQSQPNVGYGLGYRFKF